MSGHEIHILSKDPTERKSLWLVVIGQAYIAEHRLLLIRYPEEQLEHVEELEHAEHPVGQLTQAHVSED